MTKKKDDKFKKELQSWTSWLIHVGLSICYGVLFFFLITNIILSQRFPSLYFSVADGNLNSIIEFLKRGKPLNSFNMLYPEVEDTFTYYESQIYHDDRTRKELITKLEGLLANNIKSRDIFYSLFLLYQKEGNQDKASEYLKQAKEIDPSMPN